MPVICLRPEEDPQSKGLVMAETCPWSHLGPWVGLGQSRTGLKTWAWGELGVGVGPPVLVLCHIGRWEGDGPASEQSGVGGAVGLAPVSLVGFLQRLCCSGLEKIAVVGCYLVGSRTQSW